MKKNRASFFNDQIDYAQINSNIYNQNVPSQNMMMPANTPVMPSMSAQSSFQQGPGLGMMNSSSAQMMMPGLSQTSDNMDLESRLAKIERQINRLDHRLIKLENQNTISTNDFESNINDMYMI